MAEPDRLAAALRYQQELEEAQRPATMNPNMAAQGQRMNLPERQVPGPVSAFGTQAMSLNPQPNQGYGTMAADMALSFIPGVGQAMAARDLERARRDNDPLGMALAGTSFVPFGKLIGALRGGKQMGPVSQLDVYHGSPYKFDQFDASKIGTGEGAQAYGHGLYFAEAPDVAGGYRAATSKDRFLTNNGFFDPSELEHLNVKVKARSGDLDSAIAEARKYSVPDLDYPDVAAKAARDLAKLEALKASGGIKANPGSLYKVDLPDAQIAKMLDWDKPFSNQSPDVQELIKNALEIRKKQTGGYGLFDSLEKSSIKDLIATIGEQRLQQAGIPGIRYLDQGSRAGGAGTSNFVVFPGSEGQLNILGRE